MTASPRPDTWMPFYIGDYLADTPHLSAAEHGAYMLLIFAYWRAGGPLADDDLQLARIARMGAREWASARRVVARFFDVDDGRWRHSRIDAELTKASINLGKRQAQTRAATEARRQRELPRDEKRDDTPNDGRNVNATCTPSPSPKEDAAATARATLAEQSDGEGIDKLSEAERRVHDACGKNPNIVNFSRVKVWLADGADLEADILPAIATCRARHGPDWMAKNLSYFDGAVADAKALRNKPMPEGNADGKFPDLPGFLDRRSKPSQFFAEVGEAVAQLENQTGLRRGGV